MNGTKVWFGIVFAFVIGLIVGGFVMAALVKTHAVHFMRGGPPRMHEVIGRELTGNLELSPSQREEVAKILAEYETVFRALGQKSKDDLQATARDMETRIRGVLSPEQQKRFDENVRRVHERMEHRRDREGPAPPPASRGSDAPRGARDFRDVRGPGAASTA